VKLLVLGCSYSRGSYGFNNNDEEELTSTHSWIDALQNDATTITHYTGYGVGYLNWLQAIEDGPLSTELDTYDACIIQESIEPKFLLTQDSLWARTTLGNIVTHELTEDSVILSRGLQHRPALQQQLHSNWNLDLTDNAVDYLHKLAATDMLPSLVKAACSHINNILQRNNIPTWVIKTHSHVDYKYQHTHAQYLNMSALFDAVGKHKELVNILNNKGDQGHFTKAGQRLLGEHVLDAWNRRNYNVEPS